MSSSVVLHACTTTTRSQLPAARVLCDSLRRHHQDAEITVLVVDGVDGAEGMPSGVRLVTPDATAPPGVLARLVMMCTSTELAGALTPYLVHMIVEQGAPAVVAFGPETEVFAPLDEVVELAVEHGVVLAPRLDAPFPDDDLEPTPLQLREAGPVPSPFVAAGGGGGPLPGSVGGRGGGRRRPAPRGAPQVAP